MVLPFLLCGAVALDEDSIEGVVVALRQAHPVEQSSDEITGVVISEPNPVSPTTCQMRVYTDKDKFINVLTPCDATTLKASGCQTGSPITCKGNQTFPGHISCSQSSIQTKPPGSCELKVLSQAMSSGVVSYVGLRGDGANTMECEMPCTNASSGPIKLCIPRGQTFAPDAKGYQNMACTQDTVCSIPAGQTVKIPLATICMSGKTLKPPPPQGVHYDLAPPDSADAKLTDRLITSTTALNANGFFDNLPPGDERPKLITQLAHWIHKGRSSSNPADTVSPESIRDDMLSKTNMPYSSMNSANKKAIDKLCSQIYKAANSTLKLAQSPQIETLIAGR